MLPWLLPAMGVAQMFQCADATPGPYTQAWTETNRCLPIVVDDGLPPLFGEDGALVREAFQAWSAPACTDVRFTFRTSSQLGLPSGPDLVGASESGDNFNVVTGVDSEEDLARIEDLRGLLAVTLALYVRQTGELVDADVVVNFQRFDFASDPDCADAYDLAGTLTHEAGHVLGFGHTRDPDATMYEDAAACETKKRDLNETDREGLCSVYPASDRTRACRAPPSYDVEGRDLSPFREQCDRIDGCQCTHASLRAEKLPLAALAILVPLAWLGLGSRIRRSSRHDRAARHR